MEMWTTNHGAGSMMGGQRYMTSYQALAPETVATPAGTFTSALQVRERRGSGITRDVWYAAAVQLPAGRVAHIQPETW
jgi:hypothetical protein